MANMCQYGVWPNCCNDCAFCLREQRIPYTYEKQLVWLNAIKQNIKLLDWENKFSYGISLLGGELYYITDKKLQDSFLDLIDVVIEYILKVSKNPFCKYSSVTNGLYDPTFLYKVIDKIVDAVGIEKVDLNFSYDLKYRFKTEQQHKIVLDNINNFHKRYNYTVGVQMILTQYVIDLWKNREWDINEFIKSKIPGNSLNFLYPHPIHTGIQLKDFFFKRSDFLNFVGYLKKVNPVAYYNFTNSTKNSSIFKYTGLINKTTIDIKEQPRLSDGKEILSDCGHSILYRCYSDCDKCVLCDLYALDGGSSL